MNTRNLFRLTVQLLGTLVLVVCFAGGLLAQPTITNSSPLPGGDVGDAYTQTLTATGGTAPYAWSVISGTLPGGLTLSTGGVISGTPNAAGTFGFTVQVADSSGTPQTTTKPFSITIAPPPSITTTSLPGGVVGTAYSQTLTETGGTAPYTWSLASGSGPLPGGLTLSSSGVISGTPNATGIFNFTAQVTDSAINTPQTVSRSFSITVTTQLVVTTTSLPNGEVGAAYSQALAATGGTTPYTWSISSGALPAGLTVSNSGIISGTPTTSGTANFTVQAIDSSGTPQTATRPLSITVTPQLSITTASPLPSGVVGVAYGPQSLTATGGTPGYSWSIASGSSLPANLALDPSGVIFGTPATAGTFNFFVKVTDSLSPTPATATKLFSLTISPALAITTTSLPSGFVGVAYSQSLTATNGTTPYTWSLTAGALPSGLTLSSSGVISGTPDPSAVGTSSFTVQVTDSTPGTPQTASRSLSITITSQVVITTTSLPDGAVGTTYIAPALSATGGTAPYTWSVISGALPSGLSLSTAGAISGSPTVSGVYTFTVRATDSAGQSASMALTIKVPPLITTTSLPNGAIGLAYSTQLTTAPGTGPFTWSVSSGALPAGLTLSSAGVISGTPTCSAPCPTTAVTSNFTVSVTDGSTPQQSSSKAFSITIQPTLTITNSPSFPLGIVGVFYSQTFSSSFDASGVAPVTWSLVSRILPPGLSLSANGSLVGTPTTAGTYTFTVQASGGNPVQTVTQTATVTINNALTITTATPLMGATLSVPYSVTLAASGGLPPYTWANAGGALPPGLSLSSSGVLSGTPTSAGNFSLTLQVSDSYTPTQVATKTFTLLVASSLSVTTSTLPNGAVGVTYSQTLTAAAGTPPYTWTVSSGALPSGLTLSSAGVISGTPTASGTFNFTVGVTDSSSPALTASMPLTITIQPALTITTTSPLPTGMVGVFYSLPIATSGPTPSSWSVSSGVLPPGISLNANGSLSGTPSVAGTFDFTIQAIGGNPAQTTSQAFHIVINAALSITTGSTLPNGSLSSAYSVSLAATGGAPPYTWTNPGGGLPPGISLSTTGLLSGTPTVPGTYSFTVQVADSFSPVQQLTRIFTITVSGTPVITTASLPNGATGIAYTSTALVATGGKTPYTWSIAAGALPDGLALSSDGNISGTPTSSGTFNFTVTLTDSSVPALTASKALSITIQSGIAITTTSPLPLGVVGAFYSQSFAAVGPSPITWSALTSLPPGLVLTSTGSLTGTPTLAGTYDFTIQASGGTPVQSTSLPFHLVINSALSITTAAKLPNASLAPYSATLTATGGVPPYTWTNSDRALPPGLTLSSSGVISGTPTSLGTYSFSVQVSDSFTPVNQTSRTFTISVASQLAITTVSVPNAMQNLAYSQQLQAIGSGPFSWVVTSGTLPAGLTLTTAGVIQGTPTATGASTFTTTVTDSTGSTSSQTLTLVVGPPVATLSVVGLPATLTPTQQVPITLSLATPYPTDLSGQLVLSFTSMAEIAGDDPYYKFSTGSRTVNFTIPANTTTAVLPAGLLLDMGTVAGTVNITANFNNGPTGVPVATVSVLAAAPVITDASAVRTASGLQVKITGYASARRITGVEFTFGLKSGTEPPLTQDVTAEFDTWFNSTASAPYGGQFSYVQSFVVTSGDAAQIQSVTVRLTNAQGSTSSTTLTLP